MSMGDGLSIKRLSKEFQNMKDKPSYDYYAEPIKGEMFEWHFTIRGPPDTDYEGGIYHGLITFPETYPFKPPSVQFLTPNGRFEINTKVCLTFTNFHPEYWQPAWTIRTIMIGLISYIPIEEESMSIGSITSSQSERKKLARASHNWECSVCGKVKDIAVEKMKEENKKNDDADIKANLPEFKVKAKQEVDKEKAEGAKKEELKGEEEEKGDEEDKDENEEEGKEASEKKFDEEQVPQEASDKKKKKKSKDLDEESEGEKEERLKIELRTREKIRDYALKKRDSELNLIFGICLLLLFLWIAVGVLASRGYNIAEIIANLYKKYINL